MRNELSCNGPDARSGHVSLAAWARATATDAAANSNHLANLLASALIAARIGVSMARNDAACEHGATRGGGFVDIRPGGRCIGQVARGIGHNRPGHSADR